MRRALATGESDSQLADRVKAAGVSPEQAAAAAAAYKSRLPEMRAHFTEAMAQVPRNCHSFSVYCVAPFIERQQRSPPFLL